MKLSEAYKNWKIEPGIALCTICKTQYEDDMPQTGGLISPCCAVVMFRGKPTVDHNCPTCGQLDPVRLRSQAANKEDHFTKDTDVGLLLKLVGGPQCLDK